METPQDSLAEDCLLQEGVCPSCEAGKLEEQRLNYTAITADDVKIIVPNLLVEVCDHCGEIVLSADAADVVDKSIAEQTEQLTPRELERIREDLGVDQTAISEILGLGSKTYHRWEKGNQVPSRSMGYYLRVLATFPEAFAWLRDRGWQQQNRLTTTMPQFDFSEAFPDLNGTQHRPVTRAVSHFHPANALFGKVA